MSVIAAVAADVVAIVAVIFFSLLFSPGNTDMIILTIIITVFEHLCNTWMPGGEAFKGELAGVRVRATTECRGRVWAPAAKTVVATLNWTELKHSVWGQFTGAMKSAPVLAVEKTAGVELLRAEDKQTTACKTERR